VKALIAGYKTLAKAICVQAILGCEPSAAPTSQTPPPPKASLVRVKSERVVKTFRLEGRLAAFRDVVLYAKLKGTIESVAVAPGARVEAGAVLAMLTSPSIAERRESAEAALQQQVASHQRLLDAAKDRGPVDPALLAEAARKVDLLRTRRNVLLKEEAQLRVTAPFPGVIAECHVQRGHDVEPAAGPRPTPLFRLQEDIKLRLVLNVPEQALGGVELGKTIAFQAEGFGDEVFRGVIARPAHVVDTRTRIMPVELDVANQEFRLRPETAVRVDWVLERAKPSLLVPASAVARTREGSLVLRMRDGRMQAVMVETGVLVEDWIEVFSDLCEGDVVAADVETELRDGGRLGESPGPAEE